MENIEKLYLPVPGKAMSANVKYLYSFNTLPEPALEAACRYMDFSSQHPGVLSENGIEMISLEKIVSGLDRDRLEREIKGVIASQTIGDFKLNPNCLRGLSITARHVMRAMSWLSESLQDRVKIAKSSIFSKEGNPHDAIGPSNNMLYLSLIPDFNLIKPENVLVIATLLLSSTRYFDDDNGHEDVFSTEAVSDNYKLIRKVIKYLQIKKKIEELKRSARGIELNFEIRDHKGDIKQTISNGSVDPVIYGYLNRRYTEEGGTATVTLTPRLGFIIRQEGKTPQLSPDYSVPSLHAAIPAYENYNG